MILRLKAAFTAWLAKDHLMIEKNEMALAFVLLVCAGMLGDTLLRLSSLDPGLICTT